MENRPTTNKIYTLSLAVLAISATFVSCGSYQSVYNDDGIYSDSPKKEQVVIIKNPQQQQAIDKNYFSNELKRLEQVESQDVFTDVDSYNSNDSTRVDSTAINYNGASPWGYTDQNDNIIVSLDLGLNNYNYWDNYYYGYDNFWRYRWGFEYGYYGNYMYYPYAYGYYRNYGLYNFYYYPPFYNPYYYNLRSPYYRYGNNRNYTYTKRNTYVNRRGTSILRTAPSIGKRYTISNSNSNKKNTLNFSSRRRSINASKINSSSVKRNGNTTRRSIFNPLRSNTINRSNTIMNSSSRRSNTSTIMRSTSSGSRNTSSRSSGRRNN